LPEKLVKSRIGTDRIPIRIHFQFAQIEIPIFVRFFQQGETLLLVTEGNVNAGQRER